MSRIFAFPKAPRCFNFLTNVSLVTKLYFFRSMVWLVCRRRNGVGHINKVKQRRARLVLRLLTTFGGSIIPLISSPLSLAILSW